MAKEKLKHNLSRSSAIGIIAIVFLAVGYQTALFIHNAAVMKITANRDHPDTVYIYQDRSSIDVVSSVPDESSCSGAITHTERVNASHGKRADAVRGNVPPSKVESFRFDPNHVSVEDLCRLGFTFKQASAIDNYRVKGGRFHRKDDFAKSYVVSDSIFRRLEPYIYIPLVDLNVADSAEFDALPGIGGWFAAKMVSHRAALGGYSCKEQLMDIYRFDRDRFDALSDLVTVDPSHVTPYPLWSLPADSLRRHPYIANWETAKAIVLFRENNPKEHRTIESLYSAGILSEETAERLSRCLIAEE